MHDARIRRGTVKAAVLGDRQGVHVGSEADAAFAGLPAAQDADDAGSGKAGTSAQVRSSEKPSSGWA
jgi:hypothetical protein